MEDEYSTKSGMGRQLRDALREIAEIDFGFNVSEHRMIELTMFKEIRSEMIDVANEVDGTVEEHIEEFKIRKGDIIDRTTRSDLETYTITFPLNLSSRDTLPDEIETYDTVFERVLREEWEQDYLDPARDNDKSSLERFLKTTPTKLDATGNSELSFTFWKADIEARDSRFSLFVMQDITNLLLGKMNYVMKNGLYEVSQPRKSDDRLPRARLSRLQQPFLYLLFKGDEYQEYWPMDFDLRRGSFVTGWGIGKGIQKAVDLPDLPGEQGEVESDEWSNIDEYLVDALLSLQEGITESSTSQSFFAFWRGVEILTLVEQGQNKEDVVKRARFAHQVSKGDIHPDYKEAIEDIRVKRNALTHNTNRAKISDHYQAAAKLLLDALLEFYFDTYSEEFSEEQYKHIFKYGVGNANKRARLRDTFDRLDKINVDHQSEEPH